MAAKCVLFFSITICLQLHGDQLRALWVTRYDYYSAEDIVRVMEQSQAAGFNTIFFQVALPPSMAPRFRVP